MEMPQSVLPLPSVLNWIETNMDASNVFDDRPGILSPYGLCTNHSIYILTDWALSLPVWKEYSNIPAFSFGILIISFVGLGNPLGGMAVRTNGEAPQPW